MPTAQSVLVCFGDSNTYGSMPMRHLEDIRRYPPRERWTEMLADMLGPAWRVHAEGLPGRTTVHADPIEGAHLSGRAAVPIVVGSHSPIDVLVLMLGVNDFKTRFSVTASDIAASVETLVAAIRFWSDAPGRRVPEILVVAPPPILETGCLAGMYEAGRSKSISLGRLLRQSAERLHTRFIDAGKHIESSEIDGIHLAADQQMPLALAIRDEMVAAGLTEPADQRQRAADTG